MCAIKSSVHWYGRRTSPAVCGHKRTHKHIHAFECILCALNAHIYSIFRYIDRLHQYHNGAQDGRRPTDRPTDECECGDRLRTRSCARTILIPKAWQALWKTTQPNMHSIKNTHNAHTHTNYKRTHTFSQPQTLSSSVVWAAVLPMAMPIVGKGNASIQIGSRQEKCPARQWCVCVCVWTMHIWI